MKWWERLGRWSKGGKDFVFNLRSDKALWDKLHHSEVKPKQIGAITKGE